MKGKKWLRNRWFNLQCWLERLIFRWNNFWDCFLFNHFKKFEEKWREIHDYPPDKEGYK